MHQFAFQLTRIHNAKMTNYDLSFLYKRSNACVEITNSPHMQMNAIMQEERIRNWDLCAALRLIRIAGSDLAEWVAFFEPYGRSDITIDAFLANYQYFIDQAFEKLARVSR